MRLAMTRAISPKMADCELTYLQRAPIDIEQAQIQHKAYEQALERLGCQLVAAPPAPDLPDSVFIEDTALVLDEVAVITRPGAESRRAETAGVAEALGVYRKLVWISAPGTLDGGDILRVGKTIYVGVSSRSSRTGIEQLADLVARFGYRVEAVALSGCLHLKSAVSLARPDTLLIHPGWVDGAVFGGLDRIEIDPREPHAANALLIGEGLVYPASCPRTRERLEQAGIWPVVVDMSEMEKAEGAVTCCSLVFAGEGFN